jgi:predicted unusual protein kinase regulating ubiquinone biosynthesis (AarF/ABC1/UbiB family)
MVNEYENNIYFYNKYINNDVIVIPKPLIKSKNFLIMEYIEGEFLEKMDVSIYKKQILMSFLSIFIKDTYMFGKYIHCDLHDANWKVLKQKKNKLYSDNGKDDGDDGFIYKIVIYDFGYIIENNSNEHIKNLIYYLDLNNTYEIGKILFEHIENLKIKSTNSLEFINYKENLISTFVKYNERCYPYTESNLLACYNFCHSNEYKLKNNLLDLFVSIMLLNKYFKKYLFSDCICINDDTKCFNEKKYYDSVYNINLFYISICEKYDIFHNVKDFLNNKYINNSFFIKKINYNNSYFNSLIEDKDLLNKNNNFDI